MAIYGNSLSFFAEQFRLFDYFQMLPLPSSSYTKRQSLGKVKGILQFIKSGDLQVEGDVLADTTIPTLWTKEKLQRGNYFIGNADDIYRIKKEASWLFEGGFYCYVLEEVVGSTDTQEPHDYVDLGQDSYA